MSSLACHINIRIFVEQGPAGQLYLALHLNLVQIVHMILCHSCEVLVPNIDNVVRNKSSSAREKHSISMNQCKIDYLALYGTLYKSFFMHV